MQSILYFLETNNQQEGYMPLREKESFISDPEPYMTSIEAKNMYLSAKLALAPYKKMQIVRIERIEIGGSGWRIIYRISS
jgi:hypothetical protein